jgi:hypothetical protein
MPRRPVATIYISTVPTCDRLCLRGDSCKVSLRSSAICGSTGQARHRWRPEKRPPFHLCLSPFCQTCLHFTTALPSSQIGSLIRRAVSTRLGTGQNQPTRFETLPPIKSRFHNGCASPSSACDTGARELKRWTFTSLPTTSPVLHPLAAVISSDAAQSE